MRTRLLRYHNVPTRKLLPRHDDRNHCLNARAHENLLSQCLGHELCFPYGRQSSNTNNSTMASLCPLGYRETIVVIHRMSSSNYHHNPALPSQRLSASGHSPPPSHSTFALQIQSRCGAGTPPYHLPAMAVELGSIDGAEGGSEITRRHTEWRKGRMTGWFVGPWLLMLGVDQ